MLKDEGDFGSSCGKLGCTFHLPGENLEVEGPAIVGQIPDVCLQLRIAGEVRSRGETVLRILVPLQLHPHAAHAAIFGKAVKLRAYVIGEKIGVPDDPLREAGLVGRLLHIGDFILETVLCPIGLNIDGLGHAVARKVGRGIR